MAEGGKDGEPEPASNADGANESPLPAASDRKADTSNGTDRRRRRSGEKRQAKDKLDRDMVKWTRAVAVLTGGLVVAALLQFGAALLQWSVMSAQLKAMNDATPDTKKIVQANQDLAIGMKLQAGNTGALVTQASKSAGAAERSASASSGQLAQMREEERAWIAPIAVETTSPQVVGGRIGVVMNYQNTGRSPAKGINVAQQIHRAAVRNGVFSYRIPEIEKLCKNIKYIPEGSETFPSTTALYSSGIPEDLQGTYPIEAEKKTVILVWRGCFAYETGGRNHVTEFCKWLRPSVTAPFARWTWQDCPIGNRSN